MCELFGYSGDRERGLGNWLMPFRARGDNDNPDGWGVAAWRGRDANVVKSPEPGFSSAQFAQLAAGLTRMFVRSPPYPRPNGGHKCHEIVQKQDLRPHPHPHPPPRRGLQIARCARGLRVPDFGVGVLVPDFGVGVRGAAKLYFTRSTSLAIAHVRKARHPPVAGMLDTHPFAHNGLVPEVIAWQAVGSLCHPVGDTDSEYAFCHLLTEIAGSYGGAEHPTWIARLAGLSERIAALGKFNFLLSDGQMLIAYGHDRWHHLEFDAAQGRRSIIATEALTDDAWQPFSPGELRVYRDGTLLA